MKLNPYILLLLHLIQELLRFTELSFFHLLHSGTITCPELPEIDGSVRRQLNHVRSNFGERQPNHRECSIHSSPKFLACGGKLYEAGFDFGVLLLVTSLGRAREVTTRKG